MIILEIITELITLEIITIVVMLQWYNSII